MATLRRTGNGSYNLDMSKEVRDAQWANYHAEQRAQDQARKEQQAWLVGNLAGKLLGGGLVRVLFSRRLRYALQVPLHLLFSIIVSAMVVSPALRFLPINSNNRSAVHTTEVIAWTLVLVIGVLWTAAYIRFRTIPKMRRLRQSW